MVRKAEELAAKHGWFYPTQFTNPANPKYHASTTGAEILSDFASLPLDYFVTGIGTAAAAHRQRPRAHACAHCCRHCRHRDGRRQSDSRRAARDQNHCVRAGQRAHLQRQERVGGARAVVSARDA